MARSRLVAVKGLKRDYAKLHSCVYCPSIGVLCNSQGGRGRAVGDRNRTVFL